MYFLRQFGAWSTVCMTGLMTNSTSCVPATGVDRMHSLALGKSNNLYVSVVRSGASFIQVRSSLSLALMNEIPLPAVTGACLSLTPTCIAGSPVLGCVDTTGKIVFVSTDARGVDTAADWPMEGHDPGRTNNSTTDLTPYACP